MAALSLLYALCMWISLVYPSLGTGFVYHFPGITVQRQRIKSEQSGSTGPPGTGSRTQLRWAHADWRWRLFTAKCNPDLLLVNHSFIYHVINVEYIWLLSCSINNKRVVYFISALGTGVSTLFPEQCPVRCTMVQKPQCRECFRVADGLDPAPKSSGTLSYPSFQPSSLPPVSFLSFLGCWNCFAVQFQSWGQGGI